MTAGTGTPAAPYLCPFCGEEDLRPDQGGLWTCLSCLRIFTIALHGLLSPDRSPGATGAGTPPAPSRRPESHRSHSS